MSSRVDARAPDRRPRPGGIERSEMRRARRERRRRRVDGSSPSKTSVRCRRPAALGLFLACGPCRRLSRRSRIARAKAPALLPRPKTNRLHASPRRADPLDLERADRQVIDAGLSRGAADGERADGDGADRDGANDERADGASPMPLRRWPSEPLALGAALAVSCGASPFAAITARSVSAARRGRASAQPASAASRASAQTAAPRTSGDGSSSSALGLGSERRVARIADGDQHVADEAVAADALDRRAGEQRAEAPHRRGRARSASGGAASSSRALRASPRASPARTCSTGRRRGNRRSHRCGCPSPRGTPAGSAPCARW